MHIAHIYTDFSTCKYTTIITHSHSHTHHSTSTSRLINTMLVVDPQRRASLEQVAAHQWLEIGNDEDPEPVAAIADFKELPDDEVELILSRMVQGNYGSEEDIIR